MALYATPAQVRAYVQGSGVIVPADDGEVGRLIERAEREIDLVLGPWPRFSNGRKLDPPALSVTAREALQRATAAQVEFDSAMGADVLVGAQDGIAAIGGISFSRDPLPRTAPRAVEELAGHGLLIRSGTVEVENVPAA